MAFVEERVREIEHKYAHLIQDLLVLRLTEETLRLVLVLNDGTTLHSHKLKGQLSGVWACSVG